MAKEKTYGDLLSQKRSLQQLEKTDIHITTGSLIFDIFTGGGYSPGIARFMAPPEHGKTLQALCWAKNWLDYWGDKGEVYYFDCEGRMSPKKLTLSGVDKVKNFDERFHIYKYNVYDDIASFLYDITMNNPDEKHYFIVFDSLDMLITKEDTNKGFSDAQKVGAAQVMTTLLMKKVGPYMLDKGHHLHILSQVRANINIQNPNSPKTKMSGGNAALHSADIMGEVIKNFGGADGMFIFENPQGKTIKEKGNIVGHYHTIKFTKTPNEKTGQTIKIPIKRGHGIWVEREIVDLAIAFGYIAREGQGSYELNAEWISEINSWVTNFRREKFIEDGVKKSDDKSKPAIKELRKSLEEESQKLPNFEVEVKWRGYEAAFKYFSSQPDVIAWMDRKFRETLVSDSVSFETPENDETT